MTRSFPGVRARSKISSSGKKDVYFSIRYTVNKKQYEEPIGLKSHGWTPERAYNILAKLKKAIKEGSANSLKEMNAQEQAKRQQILYERIEAKKKEKTLREVFFQCYLPHFQKVRKKTTNDRELNLFNVWIDPFLGSLPLLRISRNSLVSLRDKMAQKGLAPRTQNYAIALIRQIFNFAEKNEMYEGKNPASNFDFIKIDNARTEFFSETQKEVLLCELKKRSYQVYLITLISLDCGLRLGEIFNLTWADIDLERKELTLRDTKNKRNRFAFMTDRVYEEMIKLPVKEGNQLLFTSRKGGKIKTLSRTYERTIKALGFNNGITDRRQKLVFHSCRHTFASRLVAKNVPLYDVSVLLGHSSLKMTQRYSHLSEEGLRKAVETLNSNNLEKDNKNE